jgi:DNA-binding MarR family transcriptional regulator
MNEYTYKSDLSDDEKVLMAIVRTAEIFKRNHSTVFRNYGLSFSQYNVLRVLDASTNGQNRMSEISRIMLVAGANITGIAKRLASYGFIIKKPTRPTSESPYLKLRPKEKERSRTSKRKRTTGWSSCWRIFPGANGWIFWKRSGGSLGVAEN